MFFSALKKAGSPISRPQLKPGAKRQGTVRVAWNEIMNEEMIGHTQKDGEDQQIGREETIGRGVAVAHLAPPFLVPDCVEPVSRRALIVDATAAPHPPAGTFSP